MDASTAVVFIIRSSMEKDTRRIQIKNSNYPFQPQIGGHFCLPPVDGRVCPVARITDAEYPVSNYFKEEHEMTCYAVTHHDDFDKYFKWLDNLKKNGAGLTHQWERWSIFSI